MCVKIICVDHCILVIVPTGADPTQAAMTVGVANVLCDDRPPLAWPAAPPAPPPAPLWPYPGKTSPPTTASLVATRQLHCETVLEFFYRSTNNSFFSLFGRKQKEIDRARPRGMLEVWFGAELFWPSTTDYMVVYTTLATDNVIVTNT